VKILVLGARGTLGRVVAPRLIAAGHEVRRSSRRPGPAGWVVADLATGAGLADAVDGTDAVVHLGSATRPWQNADRVDVEGTRRLVDAATAAGVRHLLYVSIVGIDRVPLPYYRRKLAAEKVVSGAGLPYTILRATQFYELADGAMRATARFGFVLADRRVLAQPVDTRDVSDRIAGLLTTGPTGGVEEYGGPEVLNMAREARAWLAAHGRRGVVVPIRIPGRIGREMRAGALTTTALPKGGRTWAAYLAERR
jgi:uncharacterized protein YbjT (DUF2867 family)